MKKNIFTFFSLSFAKGPKSVVTSWSVLRTFVNRSLPFAFCFSSFAFCLLPFLGFAQTVSVEVLIAPPVASHITDYINQNLLKITNNSTQPVSIYLKGTLTSDNGISGRTKDGYRPKRPIIVPPNNQPLILQATQQNGVDFTDNKNLDYNAGPYNIADIIRTGVVPEGNYTLCISAYDYTTSALLSRNDAGFNCRQFNIILPQAPSIDCDINVPTLDGTKRLLVNTSDDAFNPAIINPTRIHFSWAPTNANGKAIIVAYDLYLLKLQQGQNGQDALTAAIRNKQNNPIKFTDIRTNQYDAFLAITPSLVAGRYAWAVVAKDGGGGQTVFENNGVSSVCEFEWKIPLMANVAKPPAPIVLVDVKPNCDDCKLSIPDGKVSDYGLKIGDNVNIGNHTFRINSVDPDHSKGWKGTARVAIKIAGVSAIPFLIDFDNLTFIKTGDKMEAKTGTARAQKNAGAPSFVPKISKPEMPSLLDVSPNDITAMDDYLGKNIDHTLAGYKENFNNSGLQLPFGIGNDKGTSTLSIVNLVFTPEYSWFDALAGMAIGENPGMIAFGASGVCLRSDDGDGLCGNAILYLAQDLVIDALNFKLLGANGHDLKDACYLKITNSKVQEGQFVGQFDFPDNKLVRADGKPERVIAEARFKATSWSDWMAEVTIPDFKIKGAEDFTFHTSKATYDHSDLVNAKGMPDDYADSKNNTAWHGFFLPDLNVDIPGVFNTVDKKQINVGVKNLIIDNTGNVTVKIYADNVIKIENGSLDGWGYSLDHLEVNFYKSEFKTGSFKGKFLLPITDKDVQYALDYTGLFTYHNELAKDKLKYTFTVQPDANRNLNVQMWAAKLKIGGNSNIKVSNDNAEKKFHAEAHLYGELSVNTKDIKIKNVIDNLPEFNLADLKFQDLYLKSFKDDKNPDDKYFGVVKTDFTTGFASPPKSAGGFPLSITSFDWAPDLVGANASFKIGLALAFSDKDKDNFLKATGLFYIKGNLDVPVIGGGTWTPSLIGVECNGIDIKGKIGPVKIDGRVEFFNNDATWGNGLYGRLKASMLDSKMDLGNVTAQFSSKNGTPSWFIDAKMNAGFNIVPALQIYNMGAGIGYNVKINVVPNAIDIKKNVAQLDDGKSHLGQTLTGISYLPESNNTVAFRAEAYFGVMSKDVFNADAAVSIDFDGSTGGIKDFIFDGEGRYLQPEGSEALAEGDLHVVYHAAGEVFDARIGLKISNKSPIPLKQASIFLYFSQAGWHIMLGRPASINESDAVKVALIPNIAEAKAYFQVGNLGLDATPPPPDKIKEILTRYNVQLEGLKSGRNDLVLGRGLGIAFGASLEINIDGHVGPLYGNLYGGLGFDLMIQKTSATCNGNQNIGIGGWYALGDIYAGVFASIGIDVDLGFWHDKFEILSAGAGVYLKGGGPNPMWGKGAIAGGMDILGGAIHKSFSFNFSVGQECNPNEFEDALKKIEIISEILPASGNNDVEVNIKPVVAFNFPLEQSFVLEQQVKDTSSLKRVFKFGMYNIYSVTLKNTITQKTVNAKIIYPKDDKYAISIKPDILLDKKTPYELAITVSIDEIVDGKPQRAMIGNVPFSQTKIVSFITNNGLKSIDPTAINDMAPVWNQRYFTPSDVNNGFMKTNGVSYNLNSFDIGGQNSADYDIKAFARFLKMNTGKAEQGIEKPITISGDTWSYNLSQLEPNQIYSVQYLLRWTKKSSGETGTFLKVVEKRLSNGNDYEQSSRAINASNLTLGENEKEILLYSFRTSKYNSYSEKLATLQYRDISLYANNVLKRIWLYNENVPIVVSNYVKVAFNIPEGQKYSFNPAEYNFFSKYNSSYENFDVADVNGINYKADKDGNYAVVNVDIPKLAPRITFTNSDFNDWQYNMYKSVDNELKKVGYTLAYIGDGQASKFGMSVGSSDGEIESFPDPLLTSGEVAGTSAPFLRAQLPIEQVDNKFVPSKILGISYHPNHPGAVENGFGGILGKKIVAVNPAQDNQFGNAFQGFGNAFDAGTNAANQGFGVNLNAAAAGKNINVKMIGH